MKLDLDQNNVKEVEVKVDDLRAWFDTDDPILSRESRDLAQRGPG